MLISDVANYLDQLGVEAIREIHPPGHEIFAQGDVCEDVWYLQAGCVKLSILSQSGRKGVLGTLGAGEFFGEGCLTGQSRRVNGAVALVRSATVRVPKRTMLRMLREEHGMSDRFLAHVLARNIRIQEDLIDQLLHTAKERLARTLAVLARHGTRHHSDRRIPPVSQEILAEMVGTTRARVNKFLREFREKGYVSYGSAVPFTVHASLLDQMRAESMVESNERQLFRPSKVMRTNETDIGN